MKTSQGFTVVEVVVTLFVAGLLLIGGHQVYMLVLNSSNEIDTLSEADNIAYYYMRSYEKEAAASSCVEKTFTPAMIANSLPGTPAAAIKITCPYGVGVPLSKVSAVITYGSPEKKVEHAIIVK